MPAATFNQLVANLQKDGKLTSTPLIYDGDVAGEVLSGNHRVQAGIKAGIEEADCELILGEWQGGELRKLSRRRKVAIQLSHNAINGRDDPSLLVQLFDELDLESKLYSGVTDDMLKVEELDLEALTGGRMQYETLELVFVPEEADAFKALVARLDKRTGAKAKVPVLMGSLDDFDKLFEVIVRAKKRLNVINTGMALKKLAELANERLDQLEAESAAGE